MNNTLKITRARQIKKDRDSGMSFGQIGEKHGISTTRAMQIANWATRQERKFGNHFNWMDHLSVRTSNALLNAGIKTLDDLSSITDTELLAIPAIGKRAIEEIELFYSVGRKQYQEDQKIKKAISLLTKHGYKIS